jgi:hypothetical protein
VVHWPTIMRCKHRLAKMILAEALYIASYRTRGRPLDTRDVRMLLGVFICTQ